MSKLKYSTLLSFDDVWLEPQYSSIESRSLPDLSTTLSDRVMLKHPVIATNMASVVGEKMIRTMSESGSLAFRHRFLSKEDLIKSAIDFLKSNQTYFAFSIGVKDEDYDIASCMFDLVGPSGVILVDIAHGHTEKMSKMLKKIVSLNFGATISGNIATKEGYRFLADHGVDAIRVGVAGGKVCTTKYITGHHVPTLQSILDVAEVKTKTSPKIIADGGFSSSGDAAKALAAGADLISVGSVLATTSDSPSDIVEINGAKYKMHFGMSSKHAIDTYFDNKKNHVAPEGKTQMLPYSGETKTVLDEFIAGIKSAFTYSGSLTIEEFQNKAVLLHNKQSLYNKFV